MSTGGAGRTAYWKECITHFADTPLTTLFGHGKQATLVLLNGSPAHNYLIDCLYNGGLVGLALFINFVIGLYRNASKVKNTYAQSLLVSYFVVIQTISVGSNMYFWIGIILLMLISGIPEEVLEKKL